MKKHNLVTEDMWCLKMRDFICVPTVTREGINDKKGRIKGIKDKDRQVRKMKEKNLSYL